MVSTPKPKAALGLTMLKSTLKGELPAIIKFMSESGMGDSATALLYQTQLGYEHLYATPNSTGNSIKGLIRSQYLSTEEIAKKMEIPLGDSHLVKDYAWNYIERSLHIFANNKVVQRKRQNGQWVFKDSKPWPNQPTEAKLEQARKTNDSILKVSSILIPKCHTSLERGNPYTQYDDKVYGLLWDNMLKDPVLKAERVDLANILIAKQKSLLKQQNTLNIVDLGGGVGAGTIDLLAALLAKKIHANITITDEAENLLRIAQQNVDNYLKEHSEYIEQHGLEYNISYIASSIGKDEAYLQGFEYDVDTVFMSQLIHYLPLDQNYSLMQEISKYVQPKGILGVANAYSYSHTYYFPPEFMLWNTDGYRGFPYLSEIKEIMRNGFRNIREYRMGFAHIGFK